MSHLLILLITYNNQDISQIPPKIHFTLNINQPIQFLHRNIFDLILKILKQLSPASLYIMLILLVLFDIFYFMSILFNDIFNLSFFLELFSEAREIIFYDSIIHLTIKILIDSR